MDYHTLFLDLKSRFPGIFIEENHLLAPHTTLRIGGPADIFIHTKSPADFESVLLFLAEKLGEAMIFSAHSERMSAPSDEPEGSEHGKNALQTQFVPVTILGNGSNVLISDKGLRGIVIKNSSQSIEISDTAPAPIDFHHSYTQRNENEPEKYLDFTKLDYDESGKPQVLVAISSGTPLPYAINYLIDQGVTGLQWFAYIPGTVGAAVWYNLHGGNYHFSDYIESVTVLDLTSGQKNVLNRADLTWQYEKSFFQLHPELIILSVVLRLFRGDAALAASVRDAWIAQKVKVQPMNSAGSVFANPSLQDSQKIWGEQKSTGWIIDHELNWKGKQLGGAQISPQHSNFIINTGTATAADYSGLVSLIRDEVSRRFSLTLVPEVKFLGEF